MRINGFLKTTLLDYPGHLAATIFMGHCNFRCPFCHNSSLVLSPETQENYTPEEILTLLKKRVGILEGVCITGGEPTLNSDLPDFIQNIRNLGFLVKLDTNGYKPDVLDNLLKNNLLDMVAMDIKSSPQNYSKACGLENIDISKIMQSIELLKNSNIDYEFRTTLVKGIHTEEDLIQMANLLKDVPHYYLQNYKDSDNVMCPGFESFSDDEMAHFKSIVAPIVPSVKIRGEQN